MVLDDLVKCIETLRERIQRFPSELHESEATTRYVLIDPFLRALGWDTENPHRVRPEYKHADYGLVWDGKAHLVLEAKRLGGPMQEGLQQSIVYCLNEGTPYFAVTDGRRWEVNETHKPVPLEQKRVVSFDISSDDSIRVALAALCLWAPNIGGSRGSGKVLEPSKPLAYEPQPNKPSIPPSLPIPTGRNLANLQADPKSLPPQTLRMPDGATKPIKYWKDILVSVVSWLTASGRLQSSQLPLGKPNARRYIAHREPTHPNGKAFFTPVQVGSVWVEINENPRTLVEKSRFVVQQAGIDPANFTFP